MPECIIQTNLSLDEALITLNKFILQAEKYNRVSTNRKLSDKSHANRFGQQFEAFKKNTSQLEDKPVLSG